MDWPPNPLEAIPDPADEDPLGEYPLIDPISPLDILGPTAANRVWGVWMNSRTETIRARLNALVDNYNQILDFFLARAGSGYMRGHFDVGGFRVKDLSPAENVGDLIIFDEYEDVLFRGQDDVEQEIDANLVHVDGSTQMAGDLQMGDDVTSSSRIINVPNPATLASGFYPKAQFDDEATDLEDDLMPITFGAGFVNNFDMGGGRITNVVTDLGVNQAASLAFLNERLALKQEKLVVPAGTILPWSSLIVPAGYLLCNGAEVSRNTFADLFAVITTFFGEPSGGTVFKLPDLRGRVAVGQDDMGDLPAGRITESWADLMGGTGGVDRHRLTTSEIPSHTHTRVDATFASGAGGAFTGTFGVDADNQELTLARNTSDNTTVENKHQNLQPSMAVQWIIKF